MISLSEKYSAQKFQNGSCGSGVMLSGTDGASGSNETLHMGNVVRVYI